LRNRFDSVGALLAAPWYLGNLWAQQARAPTFLLSRRLWFIFFYTQSQLNPGSGEAMTRTTTLLALGAIYLVIAKQF
jgi:hypothetical protein